MESIQPGINETQESIIASVASVTLNIEEDNKIEDTDLHLQSIQESNEKTQDEQLNSP